MRLPSLALVPVVVGLVPVLAAAPAAASPAPPAERPSASAFTAALQGIVDAGVPAAVGHVVDGPTELDGAAGVADISTGAPALSGARVRAGSTTKTFVATVVLQLVQEGRLGLETRLSTVLPDTGLTSAPEVTVRQLLQHTSGIPDYSEDPRVWEPYQRDPGYVWAPDDLIAIAAERPSAFPPGHGWQYSNTNYVLLGRIVERVTGHPLRSELEARVLRPLRLRDTDFPQQRTRLTGTYLHGYVPGPDGPYDVTALSTSWAWAAGSLISTPADLARFYGALVRGQLLPEDLLAVMLDVSASHGAGYGLGIGQVELPCGSAYGHEGSVAGYWTLAYVSPDGERAAVVALTTGVLQSTPAQQEAALEALVTAFCGAEPATGSATEASAVPAAG